MQNITINNILVAITTTLDSYIHKLRDELRVELTV